MSLGPRSVRGRLALWYAGAVGVALLLYAGVAYFSLRSSLEEDLDRRLYDDYEVAEQMLERRDDGTIGWREAHAAGPEESYADADTWVEVLGAAADVRFRRPSKSPAGIPYRSFQKPHVLDGEPVVLRVGRSEQALSDELRRLLVVLGSSLLPMAAVAWLVGWLLARRVLAPIETMTERARAVTAERLSARLPVANPRDELGRLAGVFNDVLARLERSFDELRRFTADASHELRTPLTALRSVGEVALREHRDGADYREVVGSMLEEADRLTQLVDALLGLARADSGDARPPRQPTDLAALARDVVAHLGVLAEEKKQTLLVEADAPVVLDADALALRRAVTNLVDNAIRYGPSGSRVRVAVGGHDGCATVTVTDDGPGIAPENRDRVFERFFRVDPARARGGAGLGLAIAKSIVEAHGGRIELESREGAGSTFRIVLPPSDPSSCAKTGTRDAERERTSPA